MHSQKQPNSVQTSLKILLFVLLAILFLVASRQPAAADDGVPPQPKLSVGSTLLNSALLRAERRAEAMVCDGTPATIMPLGDSITLGTGSGDQPATALYNVGYRRPLYLMLAEAGYYVDFVGTREDGVATSGPEFDYDHEGHSGYRADEIATNVAWYLTVNPADVVLLHIGTNDILQDQGTDVSDVEAILDNIDSVAPDTIVVLALIIDQVPPKSAVAEFNTNLQIMAQNRIANGDNLVLVDQYNALDYDTDMFDYYHPNQSGYDKMAAVWFGALDDILLGCPYIVSEPVTQATVEQEYNYDVESLGVPAPTYALLSGPPGMTIDGSTGIISWTPFSTQLGAHWVSVQATNGSGSHQQTFQLIVSEDAVCLAPPISYWRMDELTGGTTALDDILANDATCASATCPEAVSGVVAQGLDFDGSDKLDVAYDVTLNWRVNQSVTVQTWIKTTQSCTDQSKVFMAKGGQFGDWWLGCSKESETSTNSVATFWLRQRPEEGEFVQLRGVTAINNGQWHHVLAAHDAEADMIRLYVDGQLEAEVSIAFNRDLSNDSTLSFGHLRSNYYFEGVMDEAIIHQSALTEQEVRQHYVNGLAGVGYCSGAGIAPAFVSAPLATADPGSTYTYEAQASGIPAPTYSLLAGPQGMDIDPVTGQISWVVDANTGEAVTVTVQASNGIGDNAEQSYVIEVGGQTTPDDVFLYLPLMRR